MPLMTRPRVPLTAVWPVAIALTLGALPAFGKDGRSMQALETNEQLLDEIAKPPTFDIKNFNATFNFVFSALSGSVNVYPTENYYYFGFLHGGVRYAGNLRLAAADRDQNILHFAYFTDTGWTAEPGDVHYRQLSAADGIKIIRLRELVYRVEYLGKSVIFRLNDLSSIAPPVGLLREEEIYIGPVFDESGIEFFLVFNSDRRVFHYLLNETGTVPDRLLPSGPSDRILVGQRTGFAFYRDHYLARKTLIGVHAANVRANNYLDGPFDQLPENFIASDSLKNAIEVSDPTVKGQVDRLGYLDGGPSRYLIDPYLTYLDRHELNSVEECAADPGVSRAVYPSCFAPRSTE